MLALTSLYNPSCLQTHDPIDSTSQVQELWVIPHLAAYYRYYPLERDIKISELNEAWWFMYAIPELRA